MIEMHVKEGGGEPGFLRMRQRLTFYLLMA